jgi:periplasmic protein TonB
MSTYYRPHDAEFFSKRLIIFVAIVAFHGLIVWAFVTGLATGAKNLIVTILKTNIIQENKVQELPPPPPQAKLNVPPPVTVVAPDVIINIPVAPPPVTVVPKPVTQPKPIAVAPKPIVPGKVAYAPDTADYYPAQSRRNNEEGRAMVHICVDERGRVASAAVDGSSGHALLDDAAVRLAKAYKFKPATQDGHPVQWCTGLPVKFVLTM